MTAHQTIDGVCASCNGNLFYQSGEQIVWCSACIPARALGQERIKDCTARHRDAAMQFWAGKQSVGFVVTLAGKRHGRPATHAYHVSARSLGGAIHTALTNNFILDGKARFVSARLTCPCDSGSWK